MMIYKYARLGVKTFQCENLFHFPFSFLYSKQIIYLQEKSLS